MAFTNSVDMTATGMAQVSATGQWSAPTLTTNAPVIGATANGIATTAAMTNGQVLIGSTGVAPVPATLTAGTGITVTPGAGTITIASTVTGVTWQTITASQTLVANNGYMAIAAGGALVLLLPAAPTIGSVFIVTLDGATSFQITQNAGQSIRFGSSVTTTGTGGSLTSTAQGDTVYIVAQSSTRFNIIDSVGNITIV